jgi:gliding motility-associated-like protein
MKNIIKIYFTLSVLLMAPLLTFGQINLGTVSNFVLFTSGGAVANTHTSNVTGDVGSDIGAIAGFGLPTVFVGTSYNADAVTAAAKIDLFSTYIQLVSVPATNTTHAPAFGSETLPQGVYTIAGAGSLAGALTLDGGGDTNAIFIFRFGGAFAAGAASSIILTNDARYCNIYWVAEGAISLAANTIMKGTMLANNAAVSAAAGCNIEGRMLSTTGAITFGPGTISTPACIGNSPPPPPPLSCCSPGFGETIDFVLFSGNGAVSNTHTSNVIGDIGSDIGAIAGFGPPSNLTGTTYNADGVTAQTKTDLVIAYNQLMSVPCTSCNTHLPAFGSGEILTPGVYTITGAASLAGTLILDGLGDTNAVFIFRFGGAFATGANSSVALINDARYCNIYWVAEGAISLGANTIMKGTILANNAAVSAGANCDVEGRMLSTAGAIAFGPGIINRFSCGIFCDTTLAATITPNPAIICPGDTGVAIAVNTTGGSPPFSFQWNTLDTTQSIFVGAGTYTVVISDLSNCPPKAVSQVVTQTPGTISASAGPDQVICRTVNSVQLAGSQSGGTGVVWSGGSNIFSPNNTDLNAIYFPTAAELSTGLATLYITNTGTGVCPPDLDTVVITFVDFEGINTITPISPSCFGVASGSATVNTVGVTPVYSYTWNTIPVQTGNSATNIPDGTYTLDAVDGNGCTIQETFIINQPAPLTGTYVFTDVSCFFGSDGQATVTPFGGTVPYTYSWAPSGGNAATATGLSAGVYTVTITDFNLCDTTISITISEPPVLTTSIANINHVSCFGGSDGQATVNVAGGTPGYTYAWAPAAGNAQTAIGLAVGNYTVTVLDSNGCSAVANVVINEPAAPLSAVQSQTNLACFGDNSGTASVLAAGGTLGYSYIWSPTGGTTNSETGLAAGTHTLTITDTNNCVLIETFTITEPSVLTLAPTFTNSTCGLSNGTMTANASGGVPGYTYSWSTGDTSPSVSNISAGTYSIVVTDTNNCVDSTTITIPNATPPLTASINSFTNVSCFGGNNGTATITTTGGTPGFNYAWLPIGGGAATGIGLTVGNYTVTVTDINGCIDTSTITISEPATPLLLSLTQTNVSCNGGSDGEGLVIASGGTSGYSYLWSNSDSDSIANNVTSGTYTVTVTDANGCIETGSVTITQPALLTATLVQTDVSCNGSNDGQATVTPAGGTLPYSYLWSSGGTGANETNLTTGTYTITVIDSAGCSYIDSVTITEPQPLNFTFSQTNVSCNGLSDGQTSVIVTGGSLPFSYSWSNGDIDSLNTGLVSDTYILTVTDNQGCILIDSVVITEPLVLALTTTDSDVLCFGGNTGSSTVHAVGGTLNYTYNWSPSGGSDSTALGLIAGTYTVIVNDAQGCADSITVTINEPTALTVSTTQSEVSCFGGNDGEVVGLPLGGTIPYTYSWSHGDIDSIADVIIAGNYTITVTDSNGCIAIDNATVTEPTELISNINNSVNIACFGGNDGSALVSTGGGTVPYTYLWSTGATTTSITNLIAGTYFLTTTDSLGCIDNDTIIITEPATPLSLGMSAIQNTCFGANEGTAIVVPAGGTAPYTYLWSPTISNSDSLSNLYIGTYSVLVTDTNGCTELDSIVITEPTRVISGSSAVSSTCGIANGQIHATVGGGTPAYTFSWSPGGQTTLSVFGVSSGSYTFIVVDAVGCKDSSIVNVSSTVSPTIIVDSVQHVSCYGNADGFISATATGGTLPLSYLWLTTSVTDTVDSSLTAGNYVLQVTDAVGCQDFVTVLITEPDSLQGVLLTTDVLCNGGSDGSIQAFISGGTSPYTYSWSGNGDTGNISDSLAAGPYTLTLTDSNGCQLIDLATILEPTPLNLSVIGSSISCFGGNNGTAQALVSGGTTPYVYSWSNSQGVDSLSGLVAGTYIVTVTDSNGCSTIDSITLTEPATGLLTTLTQNNVSCNGGNDGEFVVSVLGGTLPYSYLWSNGDLDSIANSISAGNYNVTVTDSNGCTALNNGTIIEPTLLISNINTSINVSCNGGSDGQATVTTSGGTTLYTYLWSTGGTNATEINLIAGTYTVMTTDSLGCADLDTIVITEPAGPLTATTTSIDNLCFGDNTGSGIVNTTGGTSPYTYFWNTIPSVNDSVANLFVGTYLVLITDTLGCTVMDSIVLNEPTLLAISFTQTNVSCNGGSDGEGIVSTLGGTPGYTYLWNNTDTDSIAENLSAAGYTVTVTDANGCFQTGGITITQPSLFSATLTQTNVSCNGGNDGEGIVTPIGGITPYTYVWSNGDLDSIAGNLIAGNYSVTITDAQGCTFTDSVNITEPQPLNFSFIQANVSCNGGSDGNTSVIVTGGSLPYSYSWSNGDLDSLNTGLVPGIYILTVTDNQGCLLIDSVTITEPTPLTSTIATTDINCFGGNTGNTTITVGGGTLNYSYLWSNGQGGNNISSLTTGTYTVTVTDGNGCTLVDTAIINQPATGLSTSLTQVNVSCNGGNDGEMVVSVLGGTLPYSYLWSNVDLDSIANNIPAGNYTVTVTDSNGCIAVNNGTITEPTPLTINIVNVVNTFCGLANGGALSTATGGTLPYSILWSNGDTTAAITNVVSGTYYVTITDSNACTQTDSIIILDVPSPQVTISTFTDVLCFGGNTGTATATPSFGIPPYSYMWAPSGATGANPTTLMIGTHYVTLTDGNGCTAIDSITIGEPTPLVITVDSITMVTCFGSSDGEIMISASGGIPGYNYTWSNGGSTANISGLLSGIHTVTVTDTNNCSINQLVVVTEPAVLNASILSFTDENCIGSNDGTASVIHTGGTAPYSYSWNTVPIQTGIIANNLAPGNYVVTVTDTNGCQTTTSIIIGSPTPVITNGIADVTICYGDSTILTGSASGGNGGYIYFWNNGIGIVNPANVAPTTTTNYIVNGIDQNGCVGTSDTVVVNVHSLFQSDLNVVANSPICPGANTLVYAIVNNPNTGPLTYSWNNGLGNTPGAFTPSPTQPTTYIVTVSNQCGVIITDSASVTFKPLPNISFIGNGIGCAPVSVAFTDLSTTIVDPITSWSWNFGDGGTSAVQNPTYIYNSSGIYNVTLTVTTNDGCTKDTTISSLVTVYPNPIASFTATPTKTDLQFPTISFTNQSSGGVSYLWDFGDGDTSNAVNPSHTYQDTGTYYVILTVINQFGCTDQYQLQIRIDPHFYFNVPNAFTPNTNGSNGGQYDINALSNNVFYPFTEFVEKFNMMIFNRWGELIFESNDLTVGWDGYYRGTLSQQDVYVWKIQLTYIDGSKLSKVGDLTLIR